MAEPSSSFAAAPGLTHCDRRVRRGRRLAMLATVTVMVTTTLGVTIERNFVPVGQTVPGLNVLSLAQPATTRGGGDFQAVINTACDIWQQALRDDYTLTLHFAWAATNSGRAEHYGLAFSRNPTREIVGSILFDATPGGDYFFFLDPTPDTSEEFRLFAENRRNYGGGPIVHERRFFAPVGPAADPAYHDLLSIAVHEVGHALGLSYANPAFAAISPGGIVAINPPRPHVGTVLALAENMFGAFTSHLDGADDEQFVMGLGEGTPTTRFLPTAGDILVLAEINRITNIDLDPHPVSAAYAPGLVADYFAQAAPFTEFAGFDRAVPVTTGIASVIRILPGSAPGPGWDARFTRHWGARFQGAIKVDVAGIYSFHLTHHGGARLDLGNVAVVQPNGSVGPELSIAGFIQDHASHRLMWHPDEFREDLVHVWLSAGFHYFGLEFCANDGANGCVLAWSGPGFAKQIVPASAFAHPMWAEITGLPAIAAQPEPLKLTPGATGSLHIGALGLPEIDYQWRKNGRSIPGATSPTLNLDAAAVTDSGIYDCAVATDAGVVVSDAVPVAVIGTTPGRPINLSVRGPAGTGENTLIAGFAIAGDPHATKTVLIRVAGPALADLDVTGFVTDPGLSVFNASGATIATNHDWDAALAVDFARVGAFHWPTGSKDAALKMALSPGEYTVHVLNPHGVSAEALIEIYDVSQDAATSLVNCSCRTFVAPGGTVIAGFAPDAPGSLLLRHAGPALAAYHVNHVAHDPTLEIFREERVIAWNDNWDAPLAEVFTRVHAFDWATDSNDAATLLAVPAGGYTVHCRVNGDGGVSLIEIYTAP